MSLVPLSTRRRAVLRAGIVLASTLVLPPARACEFYTATLRITHPWTRATRPDDTTAVLCMRFDEVRQDDRLVGVTTPVARGAELVTDGVAGPVDFAVPVGQETYLLETETFVRLTGLAHPLAVGRTYPLQLAFARGGTILATLNVEFEGAGA